MSYSRALILALALSGLRSVETSEEELSFRSNADCEGPYWYVGAFILKDTTIIPDSKWSMRYFRNIRICTGSIIAPEWVLTASHCANFDDEEANYFLFAFGNLSVPLDKTSNIRRLVQGAPYSNQVGAGMKNDIGLVMIESVNLNKFAKVSAIDYKSVLGYGVETVSAASMHTEAIFNDEKCFRKAIKKDQTKPVQIAKGVVAKCESEVFAPAICLRPECKKKNLRPVMSYTGTPMFYKGKIIGVAAGIGEVDSRVVIVQYTPVSPYLEWINSTMSTITNSNFRRRNSGNGKGMFDTLPAVFKNAVLSLTGRKERAIGSAKN